MHILKRITSQLDMEKFKVLLVDDHRILLDGTSRLLASTERFEVKDTASDGNSAVELLKTKDYDILITDYELPNIMGLELVKIARKVQPEMKIIVMSMHDDSSIIRELLKENISAYILKTDSHSSLLHALENVVDNKKYFSGDIADLLVNKFIEPEEKQVLSPRELEIIKLIAKDYSTKQIADILFISEKTVETHRKNILRKTQCSTVVGLVNYVHENNLI